jgi:hypothetical protein
MTAFSASGAHLVSTERHGFSGVIPLCSILWPKKNENAVDRCSSKATLSAPLLTDAGQGHQKKDFLVFASRMFKGI